MRCERTRPNPDLTSRTYRLRCTETAVWLVARRWLCDEHAREAWRHEVFGLYVPRDRTVRDEACFAPWAVDELRAAVERIEARTAPAPVLFGGEGNTPAPDWICCRCGLIFDGTPVVDSETGSEACAGCVGVES